MQHVMETCTNTQCSMVTCRYFTNYGRCKDSCVYHHEMSDKIRREQEKEIEKLRQEVEELKKQVKELRNTLNQNSDFPS